MAGLSGPVGDAPSASGVSRPVEQHHESFERPGGEGETLLPEHPPLDEELHGEAGDRALDEGESTPVLEEGLVPLFRKVETEQDDFHGNHSVEAKDAVGMGEGVSRKEEVQRPSGCPFGHPQSGTVSRPVPWSVGTVEG